MADKVKCLTNKKYTNARSPSRKVPNEPNVLRHELMKKNENRGTS